MSHVRNPGQSSVGQLIVEKAVLDNMRVSRYSTVADIRSQSDLVNLTGRLVLNRVYDHIYNGTAYNA